MHGTWLQQVVMAETALCCMSSLQTQTGGFSACRCRHSVLRTLHRVWSSELPHTRSSTSSNHPCSAQVEPSGSWYSAYRLDQLMRKSSVPGDAEGLGPAHRAAAHAEELWMCVAHSLAYQCAQG